MKTLIPLADGVEEIEFVVIADILRRAGWEVVSAGLRPGIVVASRGVMFVPDAEWKDLDPAVFDVLVLPGGKDGTNELCRDARVLETIRCFMASRKVVGAICAAPLVLHKAGVLEGRKVTSYPSVSSLLIGASLSSDNVVVDDKLVTSRGPGTAFQFALKLVEMEDRDKALKLAAEMLVDFH